ncbi:MAG: hypothetical protein H6741_28295 [Alphaproteobacteria bacterium]|nr:hypothetical protein [Alphaproteobacteria bacterium]MCB9796617.1 hypothetical protein [Alphaproteobacteria bacterium]
MRLRVAASLAALAGLGLAALPPFLPAPAAPTDCGDPDAPVPAFSLLDVNPGSASFGESGGPGDFLGQVVVIYFATAT